MNSRDRTPYFRWQRHLPRLFTASLINRAAARYGLPTAGVLRQWTCRNSPARLDGGGVRADAEIVLNEARG
ncbi:hypothetical protein [Streptomyces sp. NPDC046859]|uniref:hypothetical protein n=1 Tax=Streptomyces sp. NPDC046859 TaxID=3155734 RepID=UPI0034011EBF